jgi:galactose mutarotase-like enzyme
MTIDASARHGVGTRSGWEAVHLTTEDLEVVVIPGKGGDVCSIRQRATAVELLWTPRWGLRPPTALPLPGAPDALALDRSGGGWNSMFPNAGRASVEYGVDWGFHGETWLAPFTWELVAGGVQMRTALARSPFIVTKTVVAVGNEVTVTESVEHVGGRPIDVLWCQHPAFGEPLIGPATTVEITGCVVHPDMPDDAPPSTAPPRWPAHTEVDGSAVDLARLDAAGSGGARLAFLGSFDDDHVRARIHNPEIGLAVELAWSREDFPFAWYWYESGGRQDYPWYGTAHSLALEPASGYPSGVRRARELTGTELTIQPGETVTKAVTMLVTSSCQSSPER